MRPWNDMGRYDRTHFFRSHPTSVYRGLHGTDIALNDNRNESSAGLLLGQKPDVRGFHHGIGSFRRRAESACFDESKCLGN